MRVRAELAVVAALGLTSAAVLSKSELLMPDREAPGGREAEAVGASTSRLTVTERELRWDEESMLVRDLLRNDYLNIPALEERLRSSSPSEPSLCADIEASRAVPFSVVHRLMFTCAVSGHTARFRVGSAEPRALGRGYNTRVDEGHVTSGSGWGYPTDHVELLVSAEKLTAKQGARLFEQVLLGDDSGFARLEARLDTAGDTLLFLRVDDDVQLGVALELAERLSRGGHALVVTPAT